MRDDFGRRLPMDTRMIREISTSTSMNAENGANLCRDWGGGADYVYWARQPLAKRLTYFAIQEGYLTSDDIASVTGLKTSEVNKELTKLNAEGIIDADIVEK